MSFSSQDPAQADHETAAVHRAPDVRDLDAALRAVIATTQSAREPELDETIEVVTRAASTIDELIERNRAITDAAVRSVEHYRLQLKETRAEAEALRAEVAQLQGERQSVLAAIEAHSSELEAELAETSRDLESANAWINHFRAHVGNLLGDAVAKLEDMKVEGLFEG